MTRKRKNPKAAKTVQPESLRWVDHVNRCLNSAAARQSQSFKKEKVSIKLAGHEGTCKIDKDKLVEKSEYFRAMLSAGFQESVTQEVVLQEENVFGLLTLLRYIINPFGKDRWWFMNHWYEIRRDFRNSSDGALPQSEEVWLLSLLVVADKYMIPDLQRIAIRALSWEFLSYYHLESHEDPAKETLDSLQQHYDSSKVIWGGKYPEMLYPAFTCWLWRSREAGRSGEVFKTALKEDPDLRAYANAKLRDMAFLKDLGR